MRNESEMHREMARFADLIRGAERGRRAVFSEFLTPDAQARLIALARRGGLETGLFGGGEDAERAVVGIWQEGCEPDCSPIRIVRITWDGRYAAPQHRDVLGACLGLGLERETLGDIRLEGSSAYVAALPAIAEYLEQHLNSVGSASVRSSEYDGEMPAAEQGARAVVNVPSLRLDAVLAQTLRLARAKAQTLICGGAVNRNWAEETRPDVELAEGDVISVRGHGRVKIHAVQGESRKGRLFIEVKTFLKP